jgi:hypothetical protein
LWNGLVTFSIYFSYIHIEWLVCFTFFKKIYLKIKIKIFII